LDTTYLSHFLFSISRCIIWILLEEYWLYLFFFVLWFIFIWVDACWL